MKSLNYLHKYGMYHTIYWIRSKNNGSQNIHIRIHFHLHSLLHGHLVSIVVIVSFSSNACTIIENTI